MKKDRIDLVKEGLEKKIYKQINKIDNKIIHDHTVSSTDHLKNILKKEEKESLDQDDTIQVVSSNEIELELSDDNIVEKYNDYLNKKELKDDTTELKTESSRSLDELTFKDDTTSSLIENDTLDKRLEEIQNQKLEIQKQLDDLEVLKEKVEQTETFLENHKTLNEQIPTEIDLEENKNDEKYQKDLIYNLVLDNEKELEEEDTINIISEDVEIKEKTQDSIVEQKEKQITNLKQLKDSDFMDDLEIKSSSVEISLEEDDSIDDRPKKRQEKNKNMKKDIFGFINIALAIILIFLVVFLVYILIR